MTPRLRVSASASANVQRAAGSQPASPPSHTAPTADRVDTAACDEPLGAWDATWVFDVALAEGAEPRMRGDDALLELPNGRELLLGTAEQRGWLAARCYHASGIAPYRMALDLAEMWLGDRALATRDESWPRRVRRGAVR